MRVLQDVFAGCCFVAVSLVVIHLHVHGAHAQAQLHGERHARKKPKLDGVDVECGARVCPGKI